MSQLVYRMSARLARVVETAPVGTNLGLFLLLWTILSGRLLESRGAVIPALAAFGLAAPAVRRAWAALAYGHWSISRLIESFDRLVEEEGRWQASSSDGYRPVACDLVGFFRPHLRQGTTRHYASTAGKALPAIVLGLVVAVGSVGEQRVPLPRAIVRRDPEDRSEATLQDRLLETAAAALRPDEILVLDRGFPLEALQRAKVPRFLVRGRANVTARRNRPAPYSGRGPHPHYGEVVRPLPRGRKERAIAGTPPDRTDAWQEMTEEGPVTLRAEFWDDLVRIDQEAGQPETAVFHCVVLHHPRYRDPLVTLSPVKLSATACRGLYADRWPVEQVPLAGKQMLGGLRQFVFAEESCERLPEVVLLAGALLTYAGACEPPVPTGFWDRSPRPTSGRFRRVLHQIDAADISEVGLEVAFPKLREKRSSTAHLPKGILGHRRRKAPVSTAPALQRAA